MIKDPILSICIPTYNRGDCLEQILEKMAPVCSANQIKVYISDNASSDYTQEVGERFSLKYDFVHYYRHPKNIGPDDNFEFVLKMADTKYRWLMSDTCYVDDIADLLEDLSQNDLDACIVSDPYFKGSRSWCLPRQKVFYKDSVSVMKDLGWHLTWISCMIYNQRLIDSLDFRRYQNSSFNQTALMFEPTANRECLICFTPKVEVKNLPSGNKESGWHYHVFDIMYRQWYLLIMSLPLYYPYEVKKKCIEDNAHLPLMLKKYFHLKRRIEGKWTLGDLYRNRFFIKQAHADYYLLFLMGLCPRFLLRLFLYIYDFPFRVMVFIKNRFSLFLKKTK